MRGLGGGAMLSSLNGGALLLVGWASAHAGVQAVLVGIWVVVIVGLSLGDVDYAGR